MTKSLFIGLLVELAVVLGILAAIEIRYRLHHKKVQG